MSGRPARSWRSKSVLVPLALSVATATAVGLWFWLDDSHDHCNHHSHTHDPSDSEHESDAGGVGGRTYCTYPPHRPHAPHKSKSSHSSSHASHHGGSSSNQLARVDEESEPDRIGHSTNAPAGITSPVSRSKKYVPPAKKRNVVLVVSAESANHSLLDSLPHNLVIPANTVLHICIHTPSLTQSAPSGGFAATSTGAPQPLPPSKVHEKAYSILPVTYPKEYILPYQTHPLGTAALLRHIAPEIVYIEETLAGENGSVLRELLSQSWIKEGIVVLGTGPNAGLLDNSDDESLEKVAYADAGVDGKGKDKDNEMSGRKKWWEEPGWGGSVTERTYLADDWERRVVDRK
ncbi:hypothetical protein BDZ91DRAFT_796686 [Kalaharituber pfeilii]|nr:hypothetical protein BDZ91DRAFT_796686 [Kalaharituber pfeilii]